MESEKQYISVSELKDRFKRRAKWLEKDVHDQYSLGLFHGAEYDVKLIDEIHMADVAEVTHGKWKLDRYATEWTCSNCEGEMLYQVTTYGGGQYHDLDNIFPPYCPHCGAKMDLED